MQTGIGSSHVRSLIIALLTVSIAGACANQVCAQNGEDIAKGLLRALIESQLDKQNRRRPGRDPFRPNDPRPGRPTSQVQQLKTLSATYAQEATNLSAVVRTDAARDFHLRRFISDTLQFEAEAAAIRQRTASARDHATLVDSYRQQNSDWLTLSHQLRSHRGISSRTTSVLDRINPLNTQCCTVLGIQQQFDNRRLVRAADRLLAEIQHLREALRYGVPASSTRSRLIRRLQQLQQQSDYFANLVGDSRQLNQVVQEYQRLYVAWGRIEADLDRYNQRPITRSVQRVVAAQKSIHELLRIDFGLDKRLVLHLVRDVDTTMTELFQRITLADMMSLADSYDIANAADTTYGTLQHLADVVQRDEPIQEIAEAWGYVNESWELLDYYLTAIQNHQVRHHLDEISGALTSIRDTVGIVVAWDRTEMVQRASALEGVAEDIHQTVQAWHRTARIQNRQRVAQAKVLSVHCHELEQLIARRRTPAQIREECDHVIESWQQLQPYLRECETVERSTLDRLAAGFTPELVRIRTAIPE